MFNQYMPPELAQFLPVVILGLLALFPMSAILRRTGKSLWWLILCFFPPIFGVIILLYILAYTRWSKT
jgi:hypothetical protein